MAKVVGIAVALWPARVFAAPFELSWSAPADCPSREAIVAGTLARLEESPSQAPPELFVQGTVEREAGGFVVTLAMTHASGEAAGQRRVRVSRPSCQEIEAPASLVLAMMIAVARPHAAPHVKTEEPPAPPSPPPPATLAPPPRPPAAARSPGRLSLGASGVASHGLLPNPSFGAALRAMVAVRPVAFVVDASFEDGGTVHVEDGEIGFHLFRFGARLGLSVLRVGIFELLPIVGASLVHVSSSARNFPIVYEQSSTMVLAGAGVVGRFGLGRSFFVELLCELDGVLLRDRFALRAGEKLFHLHRAGAFAERASLGFGYEF